MRRACVVLVVVVALAVCASCASTGLRRGERGHSGTLGQLGKEMVEEEKQRDNAALVNAARQAHHTLAALHTSSTHNADVIGGVFRVLNTIVRTLLFPFLYLVNALWDPLCAMLIVFLAFEKWSRMMHYP